MDSIGRSTPREALFDHSRSRLQGTMDRNATELPRCRIVAENPIHIVIDCSIIGSYSSVAKVISSGNPFLPALIKTFSFLKKYSFMGCKLHWKGDIYCASPINPGQISSELNQCHYYGSRMMYRPEHRRTADTF